ncbi:hypothetical protein OH77DRAFT_454280 [Trametes cingulata]|nr:hypothetical protein OH77DRAFT_454280 [Trametes cingulata]
MSSTPETTPAEELHRGSGPNDIVPSNPPIYEVHPNFSSPNADACLRSSDDILFRVPTELLRRVSAFFHTMFTLPQGSSVNRAEPISMPEPSNILSDMLSIVSGRDLPPLDDADRLEALLAVGEKYEVPLVISVVRLAFSSRFLDVSPVRLYRIACRMSWEKEEKDALSRTLTTNLLSPEAQTELVALEPSRRTKLLDLHRRRREDFLEKLDDDTTFYANKRRCPCNSENPDRDCTAPLDHSSWWAFKYTLLKLWDKTPLDHGLGEAVYRMAEIHDMAAAACTVCERKLYDMTTTLDKLDAIIQALPRTVDEDQSGTAS